MTVSDDVRAHMERACDFLRPYKNSSGEFAIAADVRTALDLATVELERATLSARKLNGQVHP
jgi:hypothetical protein